MGRELRGTWLASGRSSSATAARNERRTAGERRPRRRAPRIAAPCSARATLLTRAFRGCRQPAQVPLNKRILSGTSRSMRRMGPPGWGAAGRARAGCRWLCAVPALPGAVAPRAVQRRGVHGRAGRAPRLPSRKATRATSGGDAGRAPAEGRTPVYGELRTGSAGSRGHTILKQDCGHPGGAATVRPAWGRRSPGGDPGYVISLRGEHGKGLGLQHEALSLEIQISGHLG